VVAAVVVVLLDHARRSHEGNAQGQWQSTQKGSSFVSRKQNHERFGADESKSEQEDEATDRGAGNRHATSHVPVLTSRMPPASEFSLPTSGFRLERDSCFGTPRFVGKQSGFLSPPVPGASPETVLQAFLKANGKTFTLHESDVLDPENAAKTRDVVTQHNGMRSVTWQQQHEGLDIFGAHLALNLTKDNRIINVQSRALHVPSLRFSDVMSVSADEAVAIVESGRWRVDSGESGADMPLPTVHTLHSPSPVWYPLDMITVVKAWDVWIEQKEAKGTKETHRLIVRADTGEVVEDINLTWSLEDASYRVYTDDSPLPMTPGPDAPTHYVPVEVARELVTLSALSTNASPLGWVPDGSNALNGNNAIVYADRDDNSARDDLVLTGTPYRTFDYACDLEDAPEAYQEQSQVQAFYWANLFHDRMYEFGFDEAAGNFQHDNLGRGGQAWDPLVIEVQNGGDLGFDSANTAWYSGWGDGSLGKVSISIWSRAHPFRCGALDSQLLLHEITHSMTTRMVGDGFGLSTTQSRGLGEGWSDFIPLALLSKASDAPDGCYPFASYAATYDDTPSHFYYGVRRFPYSTDTNHAPQTLADIDPNQKQFPPSVPSNPNFGLSTSAADQIHNIGEVWCLMLWECRANLIARHGYAGNDIMMGLVVDALKLTPENPSFEEARDAVLQADLVSHGGANQVDLWRGFAKRGLGYGAVVPGSVATAGIEESFALPFGVDVVVSETVGDGDGWLEPGESGELVVVLESVEGGLWTVEGGLWSVGPGATVTSSNSSFGDIAAGGAGTSSPPFAVTVDGGFPGNSNAWFSLSVTSDQGTFSESFAVRIGNPYDYLPEISEVVIEPGVSDVVVSWETGIESVGRVEWGVGGTTNLHSWTLMGTNHGATLGGLDSGVDYVCRIVAVGTNGLTNTTSEMGFRTHSYVHVAADSVATQQWGTIEAPFSSLQLAACSAYRQMERRCCSSSGGSLHERTG
jgi:hypothetical protein